MEAKKVKQVPLISTSYHEYIAEINFTQMREKML